ncbi:hypothetical protein BH23ACT5_BH23ACT5_21380 [soil metagenome]
MLMSTPHSTGFGADGTGEFLDSSLTVTEMTAMTVGRKPRPTIQASARVIRLVESNGLS